MWNEQAKMNEKKLGTDRGKLVVSGGGGGGGWIDRQTGKNKITTLCKTVVI